MAGKTREQLKLDALKRKELELLQEKINWQDALPHLFGQKMYGWQWDYFNTRAKVAILTAANQIGKSSANIRTCIDWCTNVKKWPSLWPKSTPRQIWYLYPDWDTVDNEFTTKWIPEFMPKIKDHAQYGWKAFKDQGIVKQIKWNCGVTLIFKAYSQDASALQAGTCHAIFCDEELIANLYDELMFRISSPLISGYFRMVFTATLNQEFWRLAMEPKRNEKENLPDAWKRQVSMYDCITFRDGTPGPYTEENITEIKGRCKNPTEIQRRVYGKFVTEVGRAYPSYDPDRNFTSVKPLPAGWKIYAGLDYGSGGEGGHPAAIMFVAVSPDFKEGVVFKGWRGDGVNTTAGDILEKYRELRGNMPIVQAWYDHSSKDLNIIAERMGESLTKADKSRDLGISTLNTLFKYSMLKIFDDEEGQLSKLSGELLNLQVGVLKQNARDDAIDAVRYCCISIPWDFSEVIEDSGLVAADTPEEKPLSAEELKKIQIEERRGNYAKSRGEWAELEEEIDEWNELYG